ncbi:two-component system response regulator YesN [Aequitasia blattaphilus]|uniref:Stage 0 sporulation protein A homolog n=1 Tax=Aequitasia blattaphilus TaxID=2949332 RepID=A0ABT1E8U9_9FIRM|nr:response regulator [Aequitasia blattaphilus]MCP1101417.1 response regulator [Aequitasia blattaphilus]MCR8614057.1 response regulator [Aequitasia blattaphilus]
MFKTLLVDDDFLVRSYLRTLPAWESEGFQVEADVRDGEEALNFLAEHKIDMIVTDVSMPLMNGIELIRRVKEKYPDVYIIVLSCHDDFEYVKEAIQLGADEYVLKNTLEENTLNPLLAQAKRKIEERGNVNTFRHKKETMISPGNENSEFLFFNRVLSGLSSEEETEEMRKSAGIKYAFHNCAVVSMGIELDQEDDEQWFELDMERYFHEFYKRLYDSLKKVEGEESINCEVVYLGAGVFCCFLDLSDERKSSVMRQQLILVATACYRICKEEPHAFHIGASDVCMGKQSIRQAYQQSRVALKMRFYEERQILYYDSERKMSEHMPGKAQQLLKDADMILYQFGKEEFLTRCLQVCRIFEEERTKVKVVIRWLGALQGIIGVEDEKLSTIKNINQVYTTIKKMSGVGRGDDDFVIPEEVNETVRVAAEYVIKHYQESIGLREVAAVAGVNSSYLSYIFSQEMGIGFSAFLLGRRNACAKKMLASTKLRITDVAAKSGFNDYHYFAKTFKKLNGVSPAEYRKTCND